MTNRTRQLGEGRGGIDLIEEAFHLLRSTPGSIMALYYVGTAPFIMGLLYFWSDMSQSAFARQRLGTASLGMVGLYLWAKVWQSVFAQRLLAQRAGAESDDAPAMAGARGIWQLLCVQAVIHSTGLFLWPLALVVLLPFGWVNAFYQSATVLGTGAESTLRSTVRDGLSMARLWPLSNHLFLLVWKGFWMFVWLNWISAAMLLPFLARTFLGIESPFTKSPAAMLNSTFFAVVTALMYLSTDPLHKAVYVLRCFYGQSLRTGRDLRAELKELASPAPLSRVAGIALLGALALFGAFSSAAAEFDSADRPGDGTAVVRAQALDESITETLEQPEYSWRLPRPERERDAGLIEGFIASVGDTIAHWLKTIGRWIGDVVDKIMNFIRPPVSIGAPGVGWIVAVRTLGFVLLIVMLFFLIMYVFRLWLRSRVAADSSIVAQPVQPAVDLTDHNVGADQLPEDEWINLGRDLLARGELRLAMRAYYLASLAHLAQRNLITLARYKSNYDYGRELRRRAHALPTVMECFEENVDVFDRSWYGLHEVDATVLSRFEANVNRIKAA